MYTNNATPYTLNRPLTLKPPAENHAGMCAAGWQRPLGPYLPLTSNLRACTPKPPTQIHRVSPDLSPEFTSVSPPKLAFKSGRCLQLVGNDLSVKLADFGLAVTDTPDNTQRSASGFQVTIVKHMLYYTDALQQTLYYC